MSDHFDLEAEMNAETGHGPDWDTKVQRARDRVDTFNALTPAEQHQRLTAPCDRTCELPETRQVIQKGTP